MTTIHYDRPVKDLIDELSETGHVYHTKYRKKSVTFHHNAGNLTFDDVLRTWTFNKASAHFDVNGSAAVAQYVEVHEYAWAVGNTEGNQETISIEMANKTGAPHWEVDEITWKEAARLAAWLFVHVIEEEPTNENVLLHKHWSATACPGPYIQSIYHKLLAEVQKHYKEFSKNKHRDDNKKSNDDSPHPEPSAIEKKIMHIQEAVGLTGKQIDGKWGPITDSAVLAFRKKHLYKH